MLFELFKLQQVPARIHGDEAVVRPAFSWIVRVFYGYVSGLYMRIPLRQLVGQQGNCRAFWLSCRVILIKGMYFYQGVGPNAETVSPFFWEAYGRFVESDGFLRVVIIEVCNLFGHPVGGKTAVS